MNINKVDREVNFSKNWLLIGLNFGLIMFIIMDVFHPLIKGHEITLFNTFTAISIWIVFGLVTGYVMKVYTNQTGLK